MNSGYLELHSIPWWIIILEEYYKNNLYKFVKFQACKNA